MLYELIAIRVGGQEFCVDVQAVREIRGWTPESLVPHAPFWMRGIINLRGVVLPIVDLGLRLGFAAAEPSSRHAIVVIEAAGSSLGLLVEAVSDIFTVDSTALQPVPDAGAELTKQFIKGVIPVENRLISFIAVDSLAPASAVAA